MGETIKNLVALCAIAAFMAGYGAGGLAVADRPAVKLAEASR